MAQHIKSTPRGSSCSAHLLLFFNANGSWTHSERQRRCLHLRHAPPPSIALLPRREALLTCSRHRGVSRRLFASRHKLAVAEALQPVSFWHRGCGAPNVHERVVVDDTSAVHEWWRKNKLHVCLCSIQAQYVGQRLAVRNMN
uniref:Uncharacterized protein n=1 Tax=Calcidiscus leptoporus TaxID=127549 RepID=A0A7S0P3G3_9EUKA